VKLEESPALKLQPHIDENIATGDQIHPAEWNGLNQVVPGEDACPAKVGMDPVPSGRPREKAPESLGRNTPHHAMAVLPSPGLPKSDFTDVRREDLEGNLFSSFVQTLAQAHRDRIGLLARRAPDHPDSDGLEKRSTSDQRPEDMVLEISESLWIAEESRRLDQDSLIKPLQLRGVLVQEPLILARLLDPEKVHPGSHRAEDAGSPIDAEVHLLPAKEESKNGSEPAFGL
jgi:hypothetical protein